MGGGSALAPAQVHSSSGGPTADGWDAMVDERDDVLDGNGPEPLDLDESGDGGRTPPASRAGGVPDLAALLRVGEKWGYIDDEGAIHVRAGRYNEDRIVAQVPPSQRADTIASLLLRFQELEDRYAALRKELRRSRNLVRNLKSLQSFVHWVADAEAIGDYDSLLGRVHGEIERIEKRMAAGQSAKAELVERAEALAETTSWKSAGEAFDELMQEWKLAGSAGRDEDEALWQRFKGARRTFFNRRNAHFAELKRSRGEAREVKERLIARAEELAPSTDYEGTFDQMQALMEEWKQAGSAGRDLEDRLWERFRAAREPFFERRREHLAGQRHAAGGRPGDSGPPREHGRKRDRGAPGGGRGRGPGGPPPRRPRGGDPGVLRSSLADLVGPLRDMFPAERPPAGGGDDDDTTGKQEG